MDFGTFLDPFLAQLCRTAALQASAEDTVSSQRSHQTGRRVAQINSCPPAGTGCSSHSSFGNDSATARPPGAPLCGPHIWAISLPTSRLPSVMGMAVGTDLGSLQQGRGWGVAESHPRSLKRPSGQLAGVLCHRIIWSWPEPSPASNPQAPPWVIRVRVLNSSIHFRFHRTALLHPQKGSPGSCEQGAGSGNTLGPGMV